MAGKAKKGAANGTATRRGAAKPKPHRIEVDHVFLATAAPEADEAALAKFGFRFSQRRVHSGQGTANACAIFENAFLELLYALDEKELWSDIVSPLGLRERIHWQTTGACPFGICFRSTVEDAAPGPWPFATWEYKAEYLPPGVTLPIVTPGSSFTEPLLFLSHRPRKSSMQDANDEMSHGHSLRKVTDVKVKRPSGVSSLSPSVSWFNDNGLVSLQEDTEYLLELEFNGGRERRMHRFPAHLPLLVRW